MSIGVGTLQPKAQIIRPVWLVVAFAVVVAFAFSVMIGRSGDEATRPVTAVGRVSANTPTELSGGIAGSFAGTSAAVVPHVPRRGVEAPTFGSSFGGTTANTPTELSGGMPAQTAGYEPIVVNGSVCGQCR